jgi:hypothetical protein
MSLDMTEVALPSVAMLPDQDFTLDVGCAASVLAQEALHVVSSYKLFRP